MSFRQTAPQLSHDNTTNPTGSSSRNNSGPTDNAGAAGTAIRPTHLEQIEHAIEHADLANILRRQDICAPSATGWPASWRQNMA